MNIIDYIREEVTRQGHNTELPDGLIRVSGMLEAWVSAIQWQLGGNKINVDFILRTAKFVEPQANWNGFRDCNVTVGMSVPPNHLRVPALVVDLCESLREGNYSGVEGPLAFYKDFEEIHPFRDGNGRTGKVLLNFLNDSLLDPIFPPNNLWGHLMRNP